MHWIITILVSVINVTAYLPQIVKLLRTRSSDDLSVASWVQYDMALGLYMILLITEKASLALLVVAGIETLLCGLITVLIIAYQGNKGSVE